MVSKGRAVEGGGATVVFNDLFFSYDIVTTGNALTPAIIPVIGNNRTDVTVDGADPGLFAIPNSQVVTIGDLSNTLAGGRRATSNNIIITAIGGGPFAFVLRARHNLGLSVRTIPHRNTKHAVRLIDSLHKAKRRTNT